MNLSKFWLRYWRLKTILISALTSNFGTVKFCWEMTCVLPSISQPNLHQIQISRGVSESSGCADFKTVIDFQNWPRFVGEKDQNVLRQVKVDRLYIDKTFVRQHLAQEIFSPEVLLNLIWRQMFGVGCMEINNGK